MSDQTKAGVTVTEMANMLGLSRARFYQLIGKAFPLPVYDIRTRRPIYVEELQKVCLEVRRRNYGINGKPVLFYTRRTPTPASKSKVKPRRRTATEAPSEIVASVRALGLNSVTVAQVESAIEKLFPSGVASTEVGQIIRAVFLHLRQNAANNDGR